MNAKGHEYKQNESQPHINADGHTEVLDPSEIQLPYLRIRVHLRLTFYSCSFASIRGLVLIWLH
jgi:hypothetical protein